MSEEALKLSEAEWLAGVEPYPMLDDLRARVRGNTDPRKMRLFACACVRDVWPLLTDERSRTAVEVAERYADHLATGKELKAADRQASELARSLRKDPFKDAGWAAVKTSGDDTAIRISAISVTHSTSAALAKEASKKAAVRQAHQAATSARQCDLIRCLFGNPFRPVRLEATFRTPAVVALAVTAYDSRTLPGFALNPADIARLADALEAVGAPSEAVGHLRGPGPHARGCWVIDAVLGREGVEPEIVVPAVKIVEPVAAKENEFAPCVVGETGDGGFSLCFAEFDLTDAVFEEAGHEGGGYGWHGVTEALVRLKAPKLRRKLRYDPEAGMLVVLAKDRDAIRQAADLIRAAVNDPAVLREAIAAADPKIMRG